MGEIMSHNAWQVRSYTAVPDEDICLVTAKGATLSRSDSGRIFWDKPGPRSYVRGAAYNQKRLLMPTSQRRGGVNSDVVVSVNPPAISERERAEADTALEGKWLYAGSWMHAFGHFLVETLPALWPLVDTGEAFDGIAAHRFNSSKVFDWQFELVRLLTDAPVHVVMEAPATVEELAVPGRPYHYQQAIHSAAGKVWDRVSEAAAPGDDADGDPVYLSRSQFEKANMAKGIKTGREYLNGEKVDEVFANRGFRVAYPETLSVMEQIRLARSAPILAGPGGSGLHLSVFAKTGARVIELGDTRTKDKMVNTQQAISAAKQQETAMVPYAADDDGAIDLGALKDRLGELGV